MNDVINIDKKPEKNMNRNIIVVILSILVITVIICLGFFNTYKEFIFVKKNHYMYDKTLIDGKEFLNGVDIVSFINKIDNINAEEEEKYNIKVSEENLKNSRKIFEDDNKDKPKKIEIKLFVEIKNKDRKTKKKKPYLIIDSKKIIEKGGEKFIEFFGKEKFHRINVKYKDGIVSEILYRIIE